MASKCIVCNVAFKTGERLQAFLRSPDDEAGSWTQAVPVDADYQSRSKRVGDRIKRKHVDCLVLRS